MKKSITIVFLIIVSSQLMAQKYFTREGQISFYSDAPLEKIEAHNSKASSVIDAETGAVEWAVLIKAFNFEKALMQEHFNENYMESSTYPKASFKGTIDEFNRDIFNEDGSYKFPVSGKLTIHGVEKEVSTHVDFAVKEGGIIASSTITVLVADYDIKIPGVVRDNIAKEVEIRINAEYKPLGK